jgi:hypothetical protein
MRAQNAKGTFGLAVVLALTILTGILVEFANNSQPHALPHLQPSTGATVLPGDLGRDVTLVQATSSVSFKFHPPQSLPTGTTLARVMLSKDDSVVRLFYNSTSLPDAHAFGGSLPFPAALVVYYEFSPNNPFDSLGGNVEPIIVQIQHEGGPIVAQTIQQSPVGTSLLVCGVNGVTQTASPVSGGTLAWWSGGVLHIVVADATTSQLLQVANSTC